MPVPSPDTSFVTSILIVPPWLVDEMPVVPSEEALCALTPPPTETFNSLSSPVVFTLIPVADPYSSFVFITAASPLITTSTFPSVVEACTA